MLPQTKADIAIHFNISPRLVQEVLKELIKRRKIKKLFLEKKFTIKL
ncbi:hypothetical protein CHY_0745 [Carboxydothermus hydrogenoformans Z-2901]|uniref:Uncharacterized protein n=1 Tax=Carboxydothermus hydrogenoformans (strain ATCC BAA-161 / DSM 6008 / Z-2901) TaxID=246194 RepID=Q3AE35_CARHZ|nr:hypothetical protein CHY_0745 [Carboxydothermus hydrogenoformans Z-2901]